MDDIALFDGARAAGGPLADRMRPRTLDEIAGQEHIAGKGRLLRRAIAADRLSSVIFYGPPGTGKTSIARVIACTTKAHFESLNAVLAGIKDIRDAIGSAEERKRLYGKRTILFVDEVHRWNKAQQDALLPWVENGTVILVGATTENPFFEVNRALVSRSRVFQLLPLSREELMSTALNALADKERGYGRWKVEFEADALEHLVEVASGDARSLLNALELAVETSPDAWPPPAGAVIKISMEAAQESIQKRAVLYDKDGDYHFDTISAFIKSVRGSDVDAALYWLARMVRAGEDPAFIFRRMLILASEDIGMADPFALGVVTACAESFDRIGFPEGNFPLTQACIYLATAPKSNSAFAYFDALKEVEKEDAEIPNHLRDSNRDKESFGHGAGYIYPHAYREHWTAQQYLPAPLQGKTFYTPSESGYEGTLRKKIMERKEIQAAALFAGERGDAGQAEGGGRDGAGLQAGRRTDEEFLSWAKESKGREDWFRRLESGRSLLLLADRNAIFNLARPLRHSRILITGGGDGLLLWEALRRVPEGLAACTVESEKEALALQSFAKTTLDIQEMPLFSVQAAGGIPAPEEAERDFQCAAFDLILGRESLRPHFRDERALFDCAASLRRLLACGGKIILLNSPPALGMRISRILKETPPSAAQPVISALEEAEEDFFKGVRGGFSFFNSFTPEELTRAFAAAGCRTDITIIEQREERLLLKKDIDLWFGAGSSWGRHIRERLGEADAAAVKSLLEERAKRGPVLWSWKAILSRSEADGSPGSSQRDEITGNKR